MLFCYYPISSRFTPYGLMSIQRVEGLNVVKWGTKLLEKGVILRQLVSVSPMSYSQIRLNRFK